MTLEPMTVHILNVAITVAVGGAAVFLCLLMLAYVVKLVLRTFIHLTLGRQTERIELNEEEQLAQALVSDLEPIRSGKFGDHPMDPIRRENLQKLMTAREERMRSRAPISRKLIVAARKTTDE